MISPPLIMMMDGGGIVFGRIVGNVIDVKPA